MDEKKKNLLIADIILGVAVFVFAGILMFRFISRALNSGSIEPTVYDYIMFCSMLFCTGLFAMLNLQYIFFLSKRLYVAQKAAQKAQKAKHVFLNNMSHDFRTPMNAIIGFSNLAKERVQDPAAVEDYLNKILYSSDNLLMLLNDVLNMSRIESGRMELDEKFWTREQIFEPVYKVYQEEAFRKNIDFNYERSYIHNGICCDRIRLQLVLMNIIGNAIKYTPDGGKVKVMLEEIPHEKEGWCYIKTTVQDNGVGISSDFLPHIFDSFEREEEATSCGIEGTGLGLSITKGLVELMGGTISIQSKKGRGTIVTMKIPHMCCFIQEEDPELTSTQKTLEELISQVDFTGKRLLLVEDNELNREIALTVLEETGFEMDCACNGQEAVEKMEQCNAGDYDLVLMDIQMPKLNGYEATMKIRGLEDKAKAGIPIIAMTANAFEEDKKMALSYGMNAHIAKPLNVTELLGVLAQYLV